MGVEGSYTLSLYCDHKKHEPRRLNGYPSDFRLCDATYRGETAHACLELARAAGWHITRREAGRTQRARCPVHAKVRKPRVVQGFQSVRVVTQTGPGEREPRPG
jgi:hypothetical protein